MIILLKGFIKEIDNTGADTQFGNTEETHDIREHASQTDEFSSKAVKEYFSGEECKE